MSHEKAQKEDKCMSGEQEELMLDVSQVVPEAQSIVRAATNVYLHHLGQWRMGVIVHGSALKGGYISGCSDVDLQIYLDSAAFTSQELLPLEVCLALHRDLALIDPSPFQYIQGYALQPKPRKGYVGPIPGAYQVVTGVLPIPEATEEELQNSARSALERLSPPMAYLPGGLLQSGGGKLARQVRFLCTDVWPMLYHVLTIQQENGLEMWKLPKQKAMELLPEGSSTAQNLFAFYQTLCRYYPAQASVEEALKSIEYGVAFLQSVKLWWENRPAL
jgi:hypothetical protein